MLCVRCGSELPDSSRYCSACGADQLGTTPAKAVASGEVTDIDVVRAALESEYEILEELGRGGMALVYRARELELDREVAIKVLPMSLAFDSEFVERFQREARTSAQLEHPNIIPIYRVGRNGRVSFLVMKYLRGGTLAGRLRARGKLTPAELRKLLIEAGGALAYASDRGVVHRDIKPDNIMFDEFGQSLLADFGIAKAIGGSRLTGTGLSIGTPHYMSPEQARAQATDGRSDLYSLGVVAFQCLTGQVPYDGEDAFAIGYKHLTEPVPVVTLQGDDARSLYRAIARLMSKDPAERYQNGHDLVATLTASAPVKRSTSGATAAIPSAPEKQASAPARTSGGSSSPAEPSRPPASVTKTQPGKAPAPQPHRRVANRSAVMAQKSPAVWPWVLGLVLVLGAAGAYARLRDQPAAAADPAAEDSTLLAIGADSSAGAVGGDSGQAPAVPGSVPGSSPSQSTATPPASAPASRDSGAIRLRNLPIGSRVLIDEQPATSAITPVPVGRHVVAISAPRHNFFADTVTVRKDDTLLLSPRLIRLGQSADRLRDRLQDEQPSRGGVPAARAGAPEEPADDDRVADPCLPGASYEARQCFDVRPRPLSSPLVTVPEGVPDNVVSAAFWIRVTDAGQTGDVLPLRTSGSAVFDSAARAVARRMTWDPAQKDGAAVQVWTQMQFPAAR
jgi:serine/threonine-protein kinase